MYACSQSEPFLSNNHKVCTSVASVMFMFGAQALHGFNVQVQVLLNVFIWGFIDLRKHQRRSYDYMYGHLQRMTAYLAWKIIADLHHSPQLPPERWSISKLHQVLQLQQTLQETVGSQKGQLGTSLIPIETRWGATWHVLRQAEMPLLDDDNVTRHENFRAD